MENNKGGMSAEMKGDAKVMSAANRVIALISILATLGAAVYFFAFADDPRRGMYGAISVLIFIVPDFLDLVFHVRFSNSIIAVFFCFCFFAVVLGTSWNLYTYLSWYDMAMHSIFGYIGCVAGLVVVCRLSDYRSLRPAFIIFVCFSVSLMCGAVWEIYEFLCDTYLGADAQGVPVETAAGGSVVPVVDTMQDIICNFCGAVVFVIHYIIHAATGKDLLIGRMKEDFSSVLLK